MADKHFVEVIAYVRAEVAEGRDVSLTNAEARLVLASYDGLLTHIKSDFASGCSQCEGLPCPGCADTAHLIASAEGRQHG